MSDETHEYYATGGTDKFTGIWFLKDIKHWYFEDKLHRLDGPAIIRSGDEYWYIDGKRCTEKAHKLLVDLMKLKRLL